MNRPTTSTAIPTRALRLEALANISASFEVFCLGYGMEELAEMMDHDAQAACGPRHARGHDTRAHRWGKTRGKIGFHGGKVEIERPRLRSFEGKEQALPSWEAAVAEDWLGKWAMNQMLINVATRKFARSVRLPEGDVPAPAGAALSKSAAPRRFVALSSARMTDLMEAELLRLALLGIRCTPRSAACCAKQGSSTTPTGPKSCFATSPSVSNETGRASPARSWKALTRSSRSRGLDCRRSCGARAPVPTSSRMS